jgi:hypothetical protein
LIHVPDVYSGLHASIRCERSFESAGDQADDLKLLAASLKRKGAPKNKQQSLAKKKKQSV